MESEAGAALERVLRFFYLNNVRDARIKRVAEDIPTHPMGEGSEYNHYPPGHTEPYRTRRFCCGEAHINGFRTERAKLDEFADFRGVAD